MRQIVINCILMGIFGFFLGFMGYPFNSWEFWVCLLLMVGVQVNSLIEPRRQ